jgi:2-octaprenyl-6-methoxyphenol hydroxylase
MKKKNDTDIIVVGGGPAGLTMTALLASNNINVTCIDRESPSAQTDKSFDGRTIAISSGSQKILEAAGIWKYLEPHACPINNIHITDGNSPVLLEYNNEEANGRSFGWIIEMRLIREAMFKRVKELPHAVHMAPAQVKDFIMGTDNISVCLEDGKTLGAKLVIGADGRQSFTREWMGISTRGWSYKQKAIICITEHENPHNNLAIENFRTQGPFAILPMTKGENGENRSSIVWTEHANKKNSAINYTDETFNAALNARFPESYGKVKRIGKKFSYPLGLIHAHDYIGERMALIGDAAHGIHPIAGQGLNLGFRDITVLTDLIIKAEENNKDPGSGELLEKYQQMRRFDNTTMAGSMDMLTRLFSNNLASVGIARKAGIKAISKIPPARKFIMKHAMGETGILPQLIKESA